MLVLVFILKISHLRYPRVPIVSNKPRVVVMHCISSSINSHILSYIFNNFIRHTSAAARVFVLI